MNRVFYWNAVLLEASRRDHSQGYANGQQSGPTATSRAMAIVHLAIHDVAACMSGKPKAAYLKKKYNIAPVKPAGATSLDKAIDGAAYTALLELYPAFKPFLDDQFGGVGDLDALMAGTDASAVFGRDVAMALLEKRKNDGSQATGAIAGAAPADRKLYAVHQVDPFNPAQGLLGGHWGGVEHFVGPRIALDAYPGHGTPVLTGNAHFKQDYDEVKSAGRLHDAARSAEQSLVGVYWGYDGAQGIGVPPRLYNQIARRVSGGLDTLAAAELFAQINVAMADAGIDAWHHKYVNNLWRPVVGIRNEQSADERDCFWAPFGAPQTNRRGAGPATPPFPAYPSGHATFGAALFQSLRLRLGGGGGAAAMTVQDVLDVQDAVDGGTPVPAAAGEAFDFVSDELDGHALDADGSVRVCHTRHFDSYAQAVWENAVSRVWLGVHWRFDGLPRNAADNIGGVPLGLEIGRQVHEYFNENESLNGAG